MQRTRRWKSAVVALSVLGAAALPAPPARAELGDTGPHPFGWIDEKVFGLDGPIVGSPALSSWSRDRLDTWVLSPDYEIWHHFATPTATGWEPLGGGSPFGVTATSWGFERADVFVTGFDGALWQRTFDRGWGPWVSLGGVLLDAASVTSGGPGQLDVVGPGLDGAVWRRSFRDGSWGPWHSLGGLTGEAPAITSWNAGRLDVFVTGIDGALWHRYAQGDLWSNWSSLGGRLGSGPAATALNERPRPVGLSGERLVVFAEGSDGLVYWRSFPGGPGSGWTGWTSTGLPTAGAPALVDLGSSRFVYAAREPGGDVLEAVISAPGQNVPTWLP